MLIGNYSKDIYRPFLDRQLGEKLVNHRLEEEFIAFIGIAQESGSLNVDDRCLFSKLLDDRFYVVAGQRRNAAG